MPLAAKINDSLRVLPLVRKEARRWHAAASRYQAAADTARNAYFAEASAAANLDLALRDQKIETTRARLDAKQWKGKAQRRSWLTWLSVLALGAGAGLVISR